MYIREISGGAFSIRPFFLRIFLRQVWQPRQQKVLGIKKFVAVSFLPISIKIVNIFKKNISWNTLNLCLGLQNKKNLIKETILNEKINILCMQETEINKNLDQNLLSFPGFAIETENNNTLSRVAVYLHNRISYIRRWDLEGVNSNLLVLDLVGSNPVRLIILIWELKKNLD